jgi:hypothetical protein
LIVSAEREVVTWCGSGKPVRGAVGTFGAENVVVVLVVDVELGVPDVVVVVVESAKATPDALTHAPRPRQKRRATEPRMR